MAHHDTHPIQTIARRATVSVIGLITACALAAGCGSNSNSTASNSGFAIQSLAFSKCIRAHGIAVTDPPGVDLQSPAYEHASAECGDR